MPGILGVISKTPDYACEEDFHRMMGVMHRETFYTSGGFKDPELGIHVGWVIQKNSFSDCLPIWNKTRDALLIFDGEHFENSHGQSPRADKGSGRTSLDRLMSLYDRNGIDFVDGLNGWFSGVLIDLRTKKCVLFNDRFGMRKVYIHEKDDRVYFASEAKAVLAVSSEVRQFDPEGLGQYLSCNCTLGERTLFRGVSRLPGGSLWSWSANGEESKARYFEPKSWETLPFLEPDAFVRTFDETFSRILPPYFNAERIGMSLTAGLDTRLIMACLPQRSEPIPTFTFGGALRDTLDIRRAREVARLCGNPHTVIRIGSDFFKTFPELAADTIRISDGALDVCNAHDLYFNRLARTIAPVRMTGKFGSEIVRDRSMFKPSFFDHSLMSADCHRYVEKAVTDLHEIRRGHPVTMSAFRELPWNEHGKLVLEQSQLVLRTPYMDNELVRLFYQAPAEIRSGNLPQLRFIQERNLPLARILTNRGAAGPSNPVLSSFARLFYYGLLKADYIYLYAMPSWLTRLTSIGGGLGFERFLLGYQKFEHYRLWFKNELSSFVKEVLLDDRTLGRSIFNRKYIERIVAGHTQRGENYMNEINRALTLELINREILESSQQKVAPVAYAYSSN